MILREPGIDLGDVFGQKEAPALTGCGKRPLLQGECRDSMLV
jgi:hypothetical protein